MCAFDTCDRKAGMVKRWFAKLASIQRTLSDAKNQRSFRKFPSMGWVREMCSITSDDDGVDWPELPNNSPEEHHRGGRGPKCHLSPPDLLMVVISENVAGRPSSTDGPRRGWVESPETLGKMWVKLPHRSIQCCSHGVVWLSLVVWNHQTAVQICVGA